MTKPLVAIECWVYNHEPYLRDCLEGIVMQQTNFPFVAVVHDDKSTDKSVEIIQKYVSKYPDLLIPIYEEENQYSKQDGSIDRIMDDAIVATSAKYVAICEGDDYWTDPLKLQKQVDYLEGHDDCVMCCHVANIEMDGQIEGNDRRHDSECDLSAEEIIEGTGLYVPMASTIYRTAAIPTFDNWPKWWRMADVGDYPLHIYGTLVGKLHYFPEVMSVYRYQRPGSWTELNTKTKNIEHEYIEYSWLKILDTETNKKYHRSICTAIFGYAADLFVNKRISFVEYWHVFKGTKNKKKINHLIKTLLARYFNCEINKKKIRRIQK